MSASMLLKSGRINVGQKQMDRFSLVIRFTLLLWLTLRMTAKPGEICTGPQGVLPTAQLQPEPATSFKELQGPDRQPNW